MQYSEIRIRVRTQDVDTAGAIAGLVVPYGFYIEDYSDIEELAPQIAHIDLIEQELLERCLLYTSIGPKRGCDCQSRRVAFDGGGKCQRASGTWQSGHILVDPGYIESGDLITAFRS